MRTFFVLFVCIASFSVATAQTVLLHEEPEDTIISQFGPNRTHFLHTYMGFGLLFGQNLEGAKTTVPGSSEWHFGVRYKLRLGETVSLGLETAYRISTYKLRQEEGKLLPDTVLHDAEQLRQEWLEPAFYLRINSGLRGNRIGRFVDAGIAAPLLLSSAHFTEDELPDGQIREVTTRRLPYIEPMVWKAFLRLGFNNLVFYGEYRLTDLIQPESGFPQLPAMSVGLQIGFH